jgi:hypothetical protein
MASISERRLHKVCYLRSASALAWFFLPGIITAAPLLDHDHDRLGLPTPADTADLSTALLHLKQSLRFFHHAGYPQSW